MDKGMRDYSRGIESHIKRWRTALKETSLADQKRIRASIGRAQNFHLIKVRDFQHERLIHLLVTLFFGFLFLFSIVFLFAIQVLNIAGAQPLAYLAGAMAIILLVTELFYIRYYYILENGVQKLYLLTDDLMALTDPSPLDVT